MSKPPADPTPSPAAPGDPAGIARQSVALAEELRDWILPRRDALREDVARLRRKLELAGEHEEERKRLAELEPRLLRAEATLAAVLGSTSWRWTAPLRALLRALRGGRERA